jgi:hypothetical protein
MRTGENHTGAGFRFMASAVHVSGHVWVVTALALCQSMLAVRPKAGNVLISLNFGPQHGLE